MTWRKSTYSSDSFNCVEVRWTRASACDKAYCVEVGATSDHIHIRDSKLGDNSPIITYTPTAWKTLLDDLRHHLPRPDLTFSEGGAVIWTDPTNPRVDLVFYRAEWDAFERGVELGEFDAPLAGVAAHG